MSLFKTRGEEKPEENVSDPKILKEMLQLLLDSETEFFIKVDGTATLPYASTVVDREFDKKLFTIKLMRPLPHEMLEGAPFQMLFAIGSQRYEAIIAFRGREAYLRYRFSLPSELIRADRRDERRFAFRPREMAYVIASDGGIPGIGVAGPVVNISVGGMAMRVDRMLKLDSGMRIPPSTARFERGMSFPRIRIQDLPNLPLLEVNGQVSHAMEHGSEIVVGFSFRELEEGQLKQLSHCLDYRELMMKTSSFTRADIPKIDHEKVDPDIVEPAPPVMEKEEAPTARRQRWSSEPSSDPLLRLKRKTTLLRLLAGGSETATRFQETLWNHGYHRLEVFPDFAKLQAMDSAGQPPLLLADLALAETADLEPLAALRSLEHQAEPLGYKTLVVLCTKVDPALLLGQSASTLFLPLENGDPAAWIEILDKLLGLSAEAEINIASRK